MNLSTGLTDQTGVAALGHYCDIILITVFHDLADFLC
jgi:hypothetical protein